MSSGQAVESWQDYRRSGKLALEQGNYVEAERSWLQALAEAKRFGTDNPRRIRSLLDLATLYQSQGRYPDAQPLYLEALEISEKTAGQDNSKLAVILNNLGTNYSAQRRHWDAEVTYRRALSIAFNAYGPYHASVATAVNNMAELYREQGRYGQAEPLYRYALAIYEFLDPSSPSVANVLTNLVILNCCLGNDVEAMALLKRALALEKPGSNQPLFQELRLNYEVLLKRTRSRRFWHRLKKMFNPEA